jgi:uncharacterized protein (TIGR02145 family)
VLDLCGSKTYKATEFCQSANVVLDLCGTKTFKAAEFCQKPNNAVLDLCDGEEFTASQFCQDITNVVLTRCNSQTYLATEQCCNNSKYVFATHFCQDGTNTVLPLCNGQPYSATHYCDNGKIVEKGQCGTRKETYDPDLYECDTSVNPGGIIYLKVKPVDYSGLSYKAVLIGKQTWMAENFNGTRTGLSGSVSTNQALISGRFYDWATAMNLADPPATTLAVGTPAAAAVNACNTNVSLCESQIQPKHKGICPEGWHLPSMEEWEILMDFVHADNNEPYSGDYPYNNTSTAGKYLKATSSWNTNNGVDKYGFAALAGGYKANYASSAGGLGTAGYWHVSGSHRNNYDPPTNGSWFRNMWHIDNGSDAVVVVNNRVAFMPSVRCVKD